jgi:hypothetical protein
LKIADVQVGEHYAVLLANRTKYEDPEHGGGGYIEYLPGVWNTTQPTKVRAVAAGVPYRNGRQGVRIEYTWTQARKCPMCGGCLLEEQDVLTNQITVHASLLREQWDVYRLRRKIELHEAEARAQDRHDRRMDRELQQLLGEETS